MKEYEGSVKMTLKEYKAKESGARIWGDTAKPYAKGDLTHYQGQPYISMIDDNRNWVFDSSWKQVFIEN